MENQSSTASSSPMQFLLLEQVQFLKVQDDDSMLQWELVDVIDAEEEEEEREHEQEVGEDGEDDADSNSNSVEDGVNDAPIEEIINQLSPVLPDPDAVVDRQQLYRLLHIYGDDEDQVVSDDDDDEDDDRCDLDDELVPWEVGNKLGRQRMKKLGKRACSKMKNSKRSPYLFVRPGCVGGKHGLGLKHF